MAVQSDYCDRERLTVPDSSTDLAAVIGGALRSLYEPVATYYVNWKKRRAFQRVVDLDPRILDDIGVTPGEVHWANSLPLDANAALELQKVARERRGIRHR